MGSWVILWATDVAASLSHPGGNITGTCRYASSHRAEAARRRNLLQPRRDIDAGAEYVVLLDHVAVGQCCGRRGRSMSDFGTNAKCRTGPRTSDVGGKPDVVTMRSNRRP